MKLTLHDVERDAKNNNKIDIVGKFVIKNSAEISASFGDDISTAYKVITIGGTKFSSTECKEISKIDYFVKLKNNKLGAIRFYVIDDYKIRAYTLIYMKRLILVTI